MKITICLSILLWTLWKFRPPRRRNYSLLMNASPQIFKCTSSLIFSFLKSTYVMTQFNELVQHILSQDIIKQHYGLIGIRKILSVADNPPIQSVIDAGLVPRMIEYVKQTEYPQLQLEATWALTNVASGTTIQCQSIIDKGGIPLFVDLLTSNNVGIV